MPNVRGPGMKKRVLLGQAINSILMYRAEIWSDGMKIGKHKNSIVRIQRKVALRIIMGYRTVSTEAALVLSGVIPGHLLATERSRIANRQGEKKEIAAREREETMCLWQEERDRSDKGRHTYRLIGNISASLGRKAGELNYYVTQFLTGHGNFGNYLAKTGKRENEWCQYCGRIDSPTHIVLECGMWEGRKRMAETDLGEELNSDNLITIAISGAEQWNKVMGYITQVMKTKEEEER